MGLPFNKKRLRPPFTIEGFFRICDGTVGSRDSGAATVVIGTLVICRLYTFISEL